MIHIICSDANNLFDYAMANFLPINGFKRIFKRELNNNYLLAPDKIEIEK